MDTQVTPRPIDDAALDQIFRTARTHNAFSGPVSEADLKAIVELAEMGPTSMNALPGRFVFVRSDAGKAKLKQALAPGNVDKTMAAPVTVIVAHDTRFHEHLPELFPHMPEAKALFEGSAELADATAFRNGSLQGAYFIIAARALGFDTGAMSGFDNNKVDELFFPEGRIKSNFLINLGRGDGAKLYPRGPRLGFERSARIV